MPNGRLEARLAELGRPRRAPPEGVAVAAAT